MATPVFDEATSLGPVTRTGDRASSNTTEVLGRIAWVLDAERVELFTLHDATFTLQDSWSATGHSHREDPDVDRACGLPSGWFPWGLGRIKPRDYLFVQNAGSLPSEPTGGELLADLGIASTLHLPLAEGTMLCGALCAMWESERDRWPADRVATLGEIARSLLDRTR